MIEFFVNFEMGICISFKKVELIEGVIGANFFFSILSFIVTFCELGFLYFVELFYENLFIWVFDGIFVIVEKGNLH